MPFAALILAASLAAATDPQPTRDDPLGLPPGAKGPVRITRVEDPKVVCFVIAASESRKGPISIASVGRKAKVTREGEAVTVAMKAVAVGGARRPLVCRLDAAARQVTSVRLGERELLAQPQPY